MKKIGKPYGGLIHLNKVNLYLLYALVMISLSFGSCKKHHYQACISVNESIINVGDTVIFTNCSNFDGGYTDCHWTFGDGKDAYTKGQENAIHSYSSAGNYEIQLTIGEKENVSMQTLAIKVH